MVNFRETSLDKDNTVNHKLNAESENSAGIHLDVENTEPDIFREPSSEKDMAWVIGKFIRIPINSVQFARNHR